MKRLARPRAPRAPEGGFTMLELVAALAILAILAMVTLPTLRLDVQRTRERQLHAALAEIRAAIDAYKRASDDGRIQAGEGASGYPPSLQVLAQGVVDASRTDGRRLYFLRRVPRDPMHGDETVPAAATWGLRSYASPPEKPEPGADVFDVHSLSPATGLDGRPYREW